MAPPITVDIMGALLCRKAIARGEEQQARAAAMRARASHRAMKKVRFRSAHCRESGNPGGLAS